MENKKRWYIFVLVLLGVYFVIMFIFVLYPSMKNDEREIFLMVDQDAKWKYENQEWQDIPVTEKDSYNWQKFDIYQNNTLLGNYYLLDNDGWYIYDDDRHPVAKDGVSMLAIRTNQEYQYGAFTSEEVSESDMTYVEQVLNEHNITTRNFSTLEMFSFDLDSDGEEEKVFTVSNIFNLDFVTPPRNIFNFIFVVDDNKILPILEEVDTYDNMYDHCKAYVDYVIDTDGNGNYEIITGCGYYSNQRQCIEMYELERGSYQQVKSCRKN